MELPLQLTPSQRKILEMASDGFTDKEISRSLGIAPGTLRTYWDRMRKRCDSRSRAEVISKMQHGLPPNRLRMILLEKMPFYIWTTDTAGKVDYCNEWFCKSGKMERKDAIKKGLLPLIVEEEKAPFQLFMKTATKTAEVKELEVHISVDAGETSKRHKLRLFPLGGSGKWIGYAREIAADADQQMSQFLIAILS